MIRQAMSSPAALQVLQRDGAEVLWRERRFMVRIDDRLITGSYDRVHLWYSNGKPIRAVLIDYKTDRVDDGTVADVVERYSEQIQLYRKALSMALQRWKRSRQNSTSLETVGWSTSCRFVPSAGRVKQRLLAGCSRTGSRGRPLRGS